MNEHEDQAQAAGAMPPFRSPLLDIVAEPPFRHEDTVLHALILDGDLDALQTSVDTLFAPLGLDLRVETGAVLCTALYVAKAFGEKGHYARLGWSREVDVAFWALARAETGPLYWVPLYMFVDSGIALIAGREIYGFPKQIARIDRDWTTFDTDLAVDVVTEHFPPAPQRIPAVTEALVKIVADTPPNGGEALSPGEFAIRFAQAVGIPDAIGDVVAPYGSPNGIKVPMLFLKQFRDAAEPERAAYRAAVAVESESLGPIGLAVAPGDWAVQLTDSASHPIAAELGLEPSNPAMIAFVIRQDFLVGAGTILAR